MYLEMSRALLDTKIELKKDKNLNSIEDIPLPVMGNLKFLQFSGSVIFSISYLEAHVNSALFDILNNRFALQKIRDSEQVALLIKGFSALKKKYDTEDLRNELFKYEKLTKKLNILYHTFGLTRLSESADESEQQLWEDLKKLQDIRNKLIHLKPDYVESEEFLEFFNSEEDEFKQRLKTLLFIVYKLQEDLPSIIPNLAENSIVERFIFRYKGDAVNEHLLTTGSLYTIENVKKHGTRWIY